MSGKSDQDDVIVFPTNANGTICKTPGQDLQESLRRIQKSAREFSEYYNKNVLTPTLKRLGNEIETYKQRELIPALNSLTKVNHTIKLDLDESVRDLTKHALKDISTSLNRLKPLMKSISIRINASVVHLSGSIKCDFNIDLNKLNKVEAEDLQKDANRVTKGIGDRILFDKNVISKSKELSTTSAENLFMNNASVLLNNAGVLVKDGINKTIELEDEVEGIVVKISIENKASVNNIAQQNRRKVSDNIIEGVSNFEIFNLDYFEHNQTLSINNKSEFISFLGVNGEETKEGALFQQLWDMREEVDFNGNIIRQGEFIKLDRMMSWSGCSSDGAVRQMCSRLIKKLQQKKVNAMIKSSKFRRKMILILPNKS